MCVFNCSVVFYSLRPHDCSLPGSSVHGILQARVLEWLAIASSRGSSQPKDQFRIFCIAGILFTAEPSGKLKYLLLGGKAGIWDKGKQQSLQERRGRKILVSKLHKCISCIKFSRFMTDSAFRSSQKFLISFTIKKESKLLG